MRLLTPPHYLVSTKEVEKEDVLTVAKALFQFCKESDMAFPGIIAEKNTALLLTHAWCDLTGKSYEVRMNQRIYQLDEVNQIPISEGEMVRADTKDIELISEWLLGFIDNTGEMAMKNALDRAKEMVENEQSVYLWVVDNHPVSMARRARKTDNGITVNLVYTPKKYRGKGYASSVVAELSRELLNNYSFCTLYTDLDNPTSNKIYMNIGFKPICDSIMITLK
ncbi:GNAT family N-acetyltransferase [Rossellomorea aquimaris]|uniref:GNAT family N-acetyltransferase n=1 Tax=Rossellomorea aquimaris TaxID=189382 RepID=UPI0007D04DB1|nr:GNAT family N-acetyltransferase [Rossellomorea aquimaris]